MLGKPFLIATVSNDRGMLPHIEGDVLNGSSAGPLHLGHLWPQQLFEFAVPDFMVLTLRLFLNIY